MKSILIIVFLFTLPGAFASLQTKKISISCDEGVVDGTLTMEFNSLNWGWQCDDLEPYGYKSYVWVHPSAVIFETPNEVYEVDVVKSDKHCNQGNLSSSFSATASCSALAKEFKARGMQTFYSKTWNLDGPNLYNGHGFHLRTEAGQEMYLTVELESWASTFFESKGTIVKMNPKKNCTYFPYKETYPSNQSSSL